MLSFLSKIVKINNLHVVEAIKKDHGELYRVLTVRKKANAINIVQSNTFESFESLVQSIDTKLPLLLLVDGKGVLNKNIDFNVEADVNWYKNIDFSTIYFTSIKGSKSSFMSFCRKNIVEDLLAKFQKHAFQVADIYIGPFLPALLSGTIKSETIISNDLVLTFENQKLLSYNKQPEPFKTEEYEIGKDVVSSDFLPLYSVLIHFFVQSKEVSKTKNATLNTEEIIYKKAFTFFGTLILGAFFVSLLCSYLLIQYYGSKNAALNLQNVYSNESYQNLLDLEKQKERKEKILRDTGLLSSKFLSNYAYEIVENVPSTIALNKLTINPLDGDIKANKKLNFTANTIVVQGATFEESSFNRWMESLRKLTWLKNFEIISLKKDKTGKSQFEIKITIKDV